MNEEIKEKKTNEIEHIAALVTGILSVVFASIWFIGLIHGITAIVCGIRTRKRLKSKLGLAGMILRNYWSFIKCNIINY